MSTPPLNPPSFRVSYEPQIATMPPEHQVFARGVMDALTDIYSAFPLIKSQLDAVKTSVSSASSSTSSTSKSSTTGVTVPQAQNIAQQTIQSTLNKTNNQTGTSYTVQNSDYQGIVTLNNAAPIAVTLGGDSTGVNEQFGTYIENLGAGVATLTPPSGLINGAASIQLVTNQGAITVFDGTNWWAVTSVPGSGGTITGVVAGTGLTGGGSSGSVTLALIVPVSVADGGTGTSATLAGLVRGSATAMTAAEISGDATTSGSNALTLATVNPDVGSFTSANITVNAKGLITAAANGSGGSGVSSLNTLTGALSLTSTGSTVSITPSGTNIDLEVTGAVTKIIAGNNVTVSPGGGTGNVTVNAQGTAYTANLTAATLTPGQAETQITAFTAPTTAVLMCSLYDPTSPGANEFLCAFAYNQNGLIGYSVTNVSNASVTVLSSTVLNIRVLI